MRGTTTLRRIRRAAGPALSVTGVLLVLGAILFIVELRSQVIVAVLGLLLLEAGVLGIAEPFLPNERRYRALRGEVDRFIGLVRRLNTEAVQEPGGPRFEGLRRELHESVDRMAEVAGREEDEP